MEHWRLIDDPAAGGAENMAADEALLVAAGSGASLGGARVSTLRLYEWLEPTVSIGYLQKGDEYKGCGVPLVRRITGGRGVLHATELTYAVVSPRGSALYALGIQGAYKAVSRAIVRALDDVGISAEFSRGVRTRGRVRAGSCFHTPSRFEVMVDDRKVVGSAQRRIKGAFLQHGSIVLDVDEALVTRLFGKATLERMGWLRSFASIKVSELKEALARAFCAELGVAFENSELTDQENYLKESLLKEKYSRPEWNERGTFALETDERPLPLAG